MRARALLIAFALFAAQPAEAGCFLFFCPSPHHHVRHHHRHPRIVHKTIVKKIIIVRERKASGPAVDRTPITPLK